MLSLIASALLLVACGDKEPAPAPAPAATIEFNPGSLSVSPEGGEASVRVQASAVWSVLTDGQDWYELGSTSQVFRGESILRVKAAPNVSGSNRRATLRFESGEATATLELTQAFFVPELSFSQTDVSGEGAGGEVVVKTTANASWQADEGDIPFWFSISPKTIVKGEGELKVDFNRSYTAEARSAEVHFRCGDQVRTLQVVQKSGEPVVPGAYVPAGYQLVWQDDFSGTSADLSSNWRFEDWAPGRVNNELQRYVPDDRRTSFVRDGALHIVARKDGGQVISARMNSRESWLYGYVEAAIRLPKGKGTWPAFWMMPVKSEYRWPQCGEIDIMEEVGVVPNDVSSSLHTQTYNHVKGTQYTHHLDIEKAEEGWHVYACEWTPDAITTFVDGQVQLAATKAEMGEGHDEWPFHYAFYPILNLAWGGNWGGMEGVDESALPITMKVDYIRVFQK